MQDTKLIAIDSKIDALKTDLENGLLFRLYLHQHGGGTGYEDFIYNGSVSSTTVAHQNVMNAEIVKATP